MAVALDCLYVTAGGACYARGNSISWGTGPLNAITAPAVKNGFRKVWVGSDSGELITLDALNGNVFRSVSLGGIIYYTGCHGPNLIVSIDDGRLLAIDPETEVVRWSANFGPLGFVESAAETMDVLTVGLNPGTAAALTTAFDANSGNILWQFPEERLMSRVKADSGVFYMISSSNAPSMLYAVRATDGFVIWNLAEPASLGNSWGPINVVGDTVFAGSEGQMLYALAASTGSIKWSAALPGYPGGLLQYSPAYPLLNFEAAVIAGFGSALSASVAAFDPATGTEKWLINFPTGTLGPIAPDMRFFTGYMATRTATDGTAYSYSPNGQPSPFWGAPWSPGGPIYGMAFMPGEIVVLPTPSV